MYNNNSNIEAAANDYCLFTYHAHMASMIIFITLDAASRLHSEENGRILNL